MKGQCLAIMCMLYVFASSILHADEIHLKNNTVVKGKIVQSDAYSVKYSPVRGYKLEIVPMDRVRRIVYDDGSIVNVGADEKNSATNVDGEGSRKLYYPMLGVTFGTPAVLNLIAGYNINRVAFLVSGMYYPMSNAYGVEWAALVHVFHASESFAGFSIIGGWTNIFFGRINTTIAYYRYNGLAFNFSFYNFYAQIGFSRGVRKMEYEVSRVNGVQWQVGYLHRFNLSEGGRTW